MRIVVFGLYNSGSTAIAGALHHLGVNMGVPYHDDFYESAEVTQQLLNWYVSDTEMRDHTTFQTKVAFFQNWITRQQGEHIGVKHPLLCLCPDAVFHTFGTEAIYLWAYRSLPVSIERLVARQWYVGHEAQMQNRLWYSLSKYRKRLHVIDWDQLKSQPVELIDQLVRTCHLMPTDEQHQVAIDSIH